VAAITLPVDSAMRSVNVRSDLKQVADLIEICFGDQMDADGQEYVRQLRRAACDTNYMRWLAGSHERVSFPLHGYVWVEDKRIVGNLSLIPFFNRGKWLYLIANVAVHPDFRRRGIARKLTQKALWHIRDHGVSAAWLQVREENTGAINLYHSLGMVEQAQRSTWMSISTAPVERKLETGIEIRPRSPYDWTFQKEWLKVVYPSEITWNLPLNLEDFNPSLMNRIIQYVNHEKTEHWSAYYQNKLIGVLTWQPSRHFSDSLWLAANPQYADTAIFSLLHYARSLYYSLRPLMVNYPAGQNEIAFWEAGFKPHNTLIWMERKFN
jgi:GNAT superfamily N-acetyltransferase